MGRKLERSVCIGGVIILVLWITINSTSFLSSTANENAIITGSGLTVVAIAIAVWAGLNIANAFDRRELLDYTEELKKRNHIINKDFESTRKTLHKMYTEEFLRTLSASLDAQHMRMSKYLSSVLRANDGLVNTDDLIELIQFEASFNRIVLLDRQTSNANSIIKETDSAIKEINEAIKKRGKYNSDSIAQFLLFLKAELYYACAAAQSAQKEYKNSALNFLKSAKGYRMYLDCRYHFDIVKNKQWGDSNQQDENDEAAYLFNAIGSCYCEFYRCYNTAPKEIRKEIEKYEEYKKSEYTENGIQKLAKKSCELATKINTCNPREVYYRNYGCALEGEARTLDSENDDLIKLLKQAQEAFGKAFNIDRTSQTVLHTVISNFDKQIRYKIGIPLWVDPNGGEYSIPKINEEERIKEIEKLLDQQQPYINAARKVFPSVSRFVYFDIMHRIYQAICLMYRIYQAICLQQASSLQSDRNMNEIKGIVDDIKENIEFLEYIAPQGKNDVFYKLARDASQKLGSAIRSK